ncbi:MarR family winged helix-turn-helix transcriptional regulator [Streptomyces griseorubiginosus]|uniref:MarR family winged helix-turn-helix transcriptional regulator n=1 Tax=Streptomyces griseorubiginosus TaxID=67304 RepID=UPI001AD666FB|nr:MarR family winged helix-turn-helix transcriptional regulator [Streptomyces griseorubiginosus]MBO4257212.1 MarR family transcriptional regulator [Streptomyces griseorubiginosus]
MPSEPSSPDLAHLLSHAARRLVQRLAGVLAEEGCSVEEWRVLSAVADGLGHPMTGIAEHVLMPAPSLTKLVDRMVAGTLVYRRPDPDDRRRVLLYLTARGRILHDRAARRVYADQARLLDAVDDQGELARLLSVLTATADGLPAAAPRRPQG